MKYIYIINSFGKNVKTVRDIKNKIDVASKSLDLDYVIEVNSENLSTDDILNKYRGTRNIMVAVGGDGMINKVLNGIVGTNNILSYIPYGTGNDFDKTVKETLDPGINSIDLVRINEKYFINIACFGIDAEIADDDRFVHSKIIPKYFRYDAGVIYHFIKYKPRRLDVYFDDEVIKDNFTTVAVCNARYYGDGYKIGPYSSLKDGLVEVYLVKELNKLKMAKTIADMKDAKHEDSPYVRKIKTDSLTIESDTIIDGNIDGERLDSKTFDIQVMPREIEVFCNQDLIEKVLKK